MAARASSPTSIELVSVVADDEACRRALLDSFAAMKTFNEYLNEALKGFAMPTR